MISLTDVYWVATGLYAVSLVVLLGWLRGVPDSRREYCYAVLVAVVATLGATAMHALGVAQVPVGATVLDVPALAADALTYAILWGITARLAGVSRRMLAFVVGLPVSQTVVFQGATVAGGGVVALLCLAFVVVGHAVLTYVLLRPVWKRAQRVPADQRLLHWKSRNLLVFLIGMIILFGVVAVGGVFDEFTIAVLQQYMNVLIRVGFAGFLFANVDSIAADGLGEALPGSDGDAGPADDAGASGAD